MMTIGIPNPKAELRKPRRVWVNFYKHDPNGFAHPTLELAKEFGAYGKALETAEFVEVTPEVEQSLAAMEAWWLADFIEVLPKPEQPAPTHTPGTLHCPHCGEDNLYRWEHNKWSAKCTTKGSSGRNISRYDCWSCGCPFWV